MIEACCGVDPLEAMHRGRSLVRCGRLEEGISLLNDAKDAFLMEITGRKSDPPELYLFVNDCYLLMMSATFSFDGVANWALTMERQRFVTAYDVEKRIKGLKLPLGYFRQG